MTSSREETGRPSILVIRLPMGMPARSAGEPLATPATNGPDPRPGREEARLTPRNGVGPTWTVADESSRLDLLDDRQRAVDRDRVALVRGAELEADRGRGVDADHAPGCIEQRAARVTGLESGVDADQVDEPRRRPVAVGDGDRLVRAR